MTRDGLAQCSDSLTGLGISNNSPLPLHPPPGRLRVRMARTLQFVFAFRIRLHGALEGKRLFGSTALELLELWPLPITEVWGPPWASNLVVRCQAVSPPNLAVLYSSVDRCDRVAKQIAEGPGSHANQVGSSGLHLARAPAPFPLGRPVVWVG